jgi:hypothetical protein
MECTAPRHIHTHSYMASSVNTRTLSVEDFLFALIVATGTD